MKNLMIAATMITAAGLAPAATTNETALQSIESALQSKSAEVRKSGVEALGIAGSKYQSRVKEMLDDKDAQVRFAAAKALYEMGDAAGEEALVRVLTGESKPGSFVSQQKREAVGTPGGTAMTAAKVGAAFSPIPGTGFAFEMSTKAIKSKSNHPERAATAKLLAKNPSPEAIAALEKALGDNDPNVRAAAIQAIAMSGNADFAKDAESMLNDKNRSVRLHAAGAYLKLSSIESSTDTEQ